MPHVAAFECDENQVSNRAASSQGGVLARLSFEKDPFVMQLSLACRFVAPHPSSRPPMSLTALAIALSLAATPVMAAPLAQLQWDKRVLVLLAEAENGDLGRQMDMLNRVRAGLAERDMVVLAVRGNEVQAVFGNAPGVDARSIRTTIGSDDVEEFEAVLIGKDGGVKQRWPQPVSVEELFAIIDAMPMRANEMRHTEK